nr:MAG TPA: hypothetical protein [Caudoviricetes sp.]
MLLKRLRGLDYKSNKELIEHIQAIQKEKDKLDKISLLSLLIKRPIVYVGAIEDDKSIVVFESILMKSDLEENVTYSDRISSFVDILKDEELNFTLLHNINVAISEHPREFATMVFHVLYDGDCEDSIAQDFKDTIKRLLPQDEVKHIFKMAETMQVDVEKLLNDEYDFDSVQTKDMDDID